MKKPNITEGGWFERECHVISEEDGLICDAEIDEIREYCTNKANAKAISAVPEMIDALVDIKQQIKDSKATDFVVESKVNRALKKAGVEL